MLVFEARQEWTMVSRERESFYQLDILFIKVVRLRPSAFLFPVAVTSSNSSNSPRVAAIGRAVIPTSTHTSYEAKVAMLCRSRVRSCVQEQKAGAEKKVGKS